MSRVMKTFDTEEEYQAWVDSPYMRTPYTCVVKSTGKVHYLDEKDDDLSITLVIKKSGWMRIGSRGIIDIISAITINGQYIDLDELGGDLDSSYYYRKDRDYYLNAEDDFIYDPQVHNPNQGGLIPYGWTPESKKLLNYYSRRFAMFNPSPGIARHKNIFGKKRFLHVIAGDTVKIFCKKDYFMTSNGFEHAKLPLFQGSPMQPRFGGDITKFSKEIIIGDGFKGEIFKGILFTYTKKVFVGKNISGMNISIGGCRFAGHHSRCKLYVRKKTRVTGLYDEELGKIIKI